jgi:hypothetical protein
MNSHLRLGPAFYAIKVAKRSDNVTVYLGDALGPDKRYKRETLDTAPRYIDRERAEIHLDGSNEIGPEIVTLYGVTEPGDWRGWHVTLENGIRTLHGPRGQSVTYEPDSAQRSKARFPWIAHWPEDGPLKDPHDRVRRFASALAARQAIERAMRGLHERLVDLANNRLPPMSMR